jgi:hypothetical protein
MKDQRKMGIEDRGFQANSKQSGTRLPTRKKRMQNKEAGSWEYENHLVMKLVWKIHEVARGKGLL